MSSGNMFNPSNGSSWDPLENLGGSSVISNQGLLHYQSDSGLAEIMGKQFFGSGNFAEMVNSFVGMAECGPNVNGHCGASEEGGASASSPSRREKRTPSFSPLEPNENDDEQQMDASGDDLENVRSVGEKKQKIEHGINPPVRGMQTGKQPKDSADNGGAHPKENYIHVRAKRGQATNSHSLAERVRRERISERMRLLQELVPGCNKITGKAVMLDEIINYVQSLQQEVEFLSMKLAAVNPELNIDIQRILSKDPLHSRASHGSLPRFGAGLSSPHPFLQGSLPGLSPTTSFHPMPPPQPMWEDDLQNIPRLGYDTNPATNNLGPNGHSKLEL